MKKKILVTVVVLVLAIIAVCCYLQTSVQSSEDEVSIYINSFELEFDLGGEINIHKI